MLPAFSAKRRPDDALLRTQRLFQRGRYQEATVRQTIPRTRGGLAIQQRQRKAEETTRALGGIAPHPAAVPLNNLPRDAET
jgi:hypothetical protein